MTANDLSKLISASVRPVVCFALVGTFIYAVVASLPSEAVAVVAGQAGFALGFYFRERTANKA